MSASVLVILDITFEAVFKDAKLQECPESSILHLKPPHICAVHPNFIKSHMWVLQIRAGLIILFYLNITPVTALCRRLSSATLF